MLCASKETRELADRVLYLLETLGDLSLAETKGKNHLRLSSSSIDVLYWRRNILGDINEEITGKVVVGVTEKPIKFAFVFLNERSVDDDTGAPTDSPSVFDKIRSFVACKHKEAMTVVDAAQS
ncbi:MAG: hypothetical protein COU07_01240 [Candidatus Harrisonbacteria bacterium CG10_big_fil_rev_8_21_14_0_10_40_38]|uniref:Uncharacterized protein n=1 Tax=Candidatus Harrisonbacteria bacterium CG10_big_fil_rev_8_21_14_0_10_40_38 TaxID=1974583 RepID=A0A2H0USX3_9BACT|nr:MAG: hypothetical protein COU07_01240 [Candidatus Harrisonbacteria bacterium CG10_big_fil_rev_8_21_14_0_10_40_38]